MIPVCGQPGVSQNESAGVWATRLIDGLRDEESCWWSTWCCCLVSGRTAQSFQIGKSSLQGYGFFIFIVIVCIIYLFSPLASILILIGGLIYYAFHKAQIRTRIRDLHQIPGSFFQDVLLHAFLPCCAVAQEAREAIAKGRPQQDYITGDDISTIPFPQSERGGNVEGTPPTRGVQHIVYTQNVMHANYSPVATAATTNTPTNTPTTTTTVNTNTAAVVSPLHVLNTEDPEAAALHTQSNTATENASFLSQLRSVSTLSRRLMQGFLLLLLIACISLMAVGKGTGAIVLLVAFFQPAYIVYIFWRDPYRISYLSWDYVIKMFVVGFFMSTTQSILFELLLSEIILDLIVGAILPDDGAMVVGHMKAALYKMLGKPHWGQLLGMVQMSIVSVYMSLSGTDVAALHNIHTAASPALHPAEDSIDFSGMSYYAETMRKNIVFLAFVMFINAFLIAACVEETMKHFAVRCCRFPAPLRDPASVSVYMMMAALGFTVFENIEYAFNADSFGMALLTLVVRAFIPVHLVCSVLQTVSYSKALMGEGSTNIFRMLLPAIAVHGAFDFFLFLEMLINAAYNVNWWPLSFVSIAIFIVGQIIGQRGFRSVVNGFDGIFAVAPDMQRGTRRYIGGSATAATSGTSGGSGGNVNSGAVELTAPSQRSTV